MVGQTVVGIRRRPPGQVLIARSQTLSTLNVETPPPYDVESLPSYTIVSGLPSYNDAIEQLKQRQQQQQQQKYAGYEPVKVHRPSVIKLFESQSQDLLGGGAKLEEIRYNFLGNRPSAANAVTAAAENSNEIIPTTSNGGSIPTMVVPSCKNQSVTVVVEDAGEATSAKKVNIVRHTLENERSSGLGS
ncbi:protein commissureless 2 homolog isoform X2 [Toxorhynchites rutilus septentrionalis]|uniref:protein commissureless 2 homolog isoform X2 n=1 Tax=Toxorhynchites rutilus septentrionalis TaxID=329112 RepID=UPI00247A612B|nr:protein commissureless 2 homolog isoform X2 [Toxorhynchites rutilus septentrionalis]